jgi:hypothetical protein
MVNNIKSRGQVPLRWHLRIAVLAFLGALGLVSCSGKRVPDASQNMTMQPSVTYLYLLRHTPFFTALSTGQLRWVIDHSHEWETDEGAVIAKCDRAGASDTDYWILLDGGWKVDYDGRSFASGHADPGKWFNTREAGGAACSLVATEHSYVMRITAADMRAMLDNGFAFNSHFDSGRLFYRSVFGERLPHDPGTLPGPRDVTKPPNAR